MLVSLLALSVLAAGPTDTVKQGNVELQKALAESNASADKLAKIADNFVDFVELAKRALGKEWNKLSANQRDEFSSTMRGLLRASYAQRALGQGKADVTYGAETTKGNEAQVPTTVKVQQDDFPVVYKLYKNGKGWRIYDVVTDDVSLVDTYRDQFRKLISEKGYDGLLAILKNKRDALEAKN
ncbi:MAG: MlaC/ttg2D family ABC transporter substrate-binding protein [Myxococcaceae bacterium]